jgi:hypothetical protein
MLSGVDGVVDHLGPDVYLQRPAGSGRVRAGFHPGRPVRVQPAQGVLDRPGQRPHRPARTAQATQSSAGPSSGRGDLLQRLMFFRRGVRCRDGAGTAVRGEVVAHAR